MDSTQASWTSFLMDILCLWILYHVDSTALCSNTFIPRILCTLYYFRLYSVTLHDFSTPLYRHAVDHQRRFKYYCGNVDCNWGCHHKQNHAALITKKIIYVEYILYYFSSPYLFLLKEVHNALVLLTCIINFNQIIVE